MLRALSYARVGLAVTVTALVIASAVTFIFELSWLLTSIIALVAIGAVAFALTLTPAPQQSSDVGSWTVFNDIRGRGFDVIGGALMGGRSSVDQRAASWNAQAVVNDALPLVAAVVLLLVWFVL